jgi:DNA polymerase I-like protein with 3'-5' exonuclease and polymerase domains/uracil-DNA glycosylase
MEPTVKSVGPTDARIMLVGEAPGEQEILRGEPFVGAPGAELTKMLHEAGIARSELFITYVARQRPFANDIGNWVATTKKAAEEFSAKGGAYIHSKMVLPPVLEGYEILRREVELVKPRVILAAGNLALYATAGEWGITDWRGSTCNSLLPGCAKVVPIIPPATVLRQWSWRQITVQDLRRAAKEAERAEIIRPDYNTVIRPDFASVIRNLDLMLGFLAAGPLKLAVDIETRLGHIACIGWAWASHEAFCLPLMQSGRPEGYWLEEEEVAILMKLQSVLTHPNIECIFQNGLYDLQYFARHLRFLPRMARDTMLAQHVCFPTMPKSLGFLSSLYCEHHRYWKDDGKEWNQKLQGEEALWTYNGEDCGRTFEIDGVEQETVRKLNLKEVHEFQQFLAWPVLATMQKGVRIDLKRRSQFALELSDELAKREQWFIDVLGHPLNPRSPAQLKKLFYDDFQCKVQRSRQTGEPTLNDEAITRLAEKEPLLRPLVRKILECRSIGVFLGTFVNAALDHDNRMRCSYNIAGTDTFRFASRENAFGSGTNLQNIPKGGDTDGGELELPNVRSLFVPDPGMTFFDTDLSSADLRVVVWESDEREMKQMLADGLDPYTEVAKEFYHDKTITKKDPRRQKFKSFCHGTNYLGTARGLAMRLGLSVAESEKTQAWYFRRFPKIREQQEALKEHIRKHHYVQNGFGYRCYFFDRIDDDVFRRAAAWIPQSSVACYINRIWVRWVCYIPEVEILLQVHDSLAGQIPTMEREPLLRQMLAEAGKVVIPYADPLVIPLGVKTSEKSWGDCE